MEISNVQIKLLGPVEIAVEGRILKISRRMERAILYFLAAEHRPVSRTTLIDLLWPDDDEIDHRAALRTALSRLRGRLPDEEMLVSELDQVWLNPDCCWIDVKIFQTSFDSLKNVLGVYQDDRALPAQIAKQIEDTLNLWRGDQFLQGDNLQSYPEIENWGRSLNLTLTHQRTTLMERLAHHYRATGQFELALTLFIRLGKMDLLDVKIHLAVLEILSRMSRYQEAVDYCDALEIAYEEAFNAPLPEAILSQYQYSQIQLQANHAEKPKGWEFPLTMDLELVGRQTELARLQKAFYSGGIVVIKGELGSGKTRMVKALFNSLHPLPCLFYAPSQELENTLPLSPFIHGFRNHVSRKVWESLDCIWATKIALLLPELGEVRQDCLLQDSANQPPSKQQLFDALHHALKAVAQKTGQILFVLDDAQWADKQSLQAIAYIVNEGFFQKNGLLILATRTEEPNPDLLEMVDRFHRDQPVETIQLNGLSPNELGELVSQVLDREPPGNFLDQLYRETNGNPFLALEILRNLMDFPDQLHDYKAAERLPLPESVHSIIRNRLRRLDSTALKILQCAAVIGNAFSVELLHSVAGSQDGIDLDLIDPLVKLGFLHPLQKHAWEDMALQFAHEKMREVVLKEITPVRLQVLHRRVAENLSRDKLAKSQAVLIANHFLEAGDRQSAFCWFLKAAEYAWSLVAKEDTEYAFEQAEALYDQAPEGAFEVFELFDLYRAWSAFAYESNQIDLLEKVGIKLQYLGERENNPLLLGVSYMSQANACFLRMEMETGLNLIHKAIGYLDHTEQTRVIIEAKLREAAFQWWLLNYDETIRVAQSVLEIGETFTEGQKEITGQLFFARQSISYAYYAKGNASEALSCAVDTYNRYFHQLSPFNRMRSLNTLSNGYLIGAEYKDCEIYAAQGLEIARNLENTFVTQILLLTQSKAEVIQGYLDKALAHASEALTLGEAENHTHSIISANRVIGDIYRHLQNYSLALQHYRVAQLRGGHNKESYYSLDNDLALVSALAWMGQVSEARSLAAQAYEISQKREMGQLHTQAILKFALCDLIEGEFDSAEAYLSQAERQAVDLGLIYEQVWCHVGRGRIALSRHQFSQAEEEIKKILEISTQRNMAWMKLRGLHFCGQLHKATRDPALLHYQQAYEDLLTMLSEHTQSAALRGDFENAKKSWEMGHAYP